MNHQRMCTSGAVYVPCIYSHIKLELLYMIWVFVVVSVMSFECYLSPLFVDSAQALQALFCFGLQEKQ